MLVQSRRYKLVQDGALEGGGRAEDGPCQNCEGLDCGIGYRVPFTRCLHLEGVWGGKCGNSLWVEGDM